MTQSAQPEMSTYESSSDEWKRGAADAWLQGSPDSSNPEYLAGWKYTCAIARLRDFAEELAIANEIAP